MSKKEIMIISIIGVAILLATFLTTYFMFSDTKSNKSIDYIQVSEYKLSYGKYVGIEEEYNQNSETVEKKKICMILSKDSITINDIKNSYKVDGKFIYMNGVKMYEIISNNKLLLLAGEGIEYEYEGK